MSDDRAPERRCCPHPDCERTEPHEHVELQPLAATVKPPLAVMPCEIWIERRIDELLAAIYRFREADRPIPTRWYSELGLLGELRQVPASWDKT